MEKDTTSTKISVLQARKKGQLKDYSAKEMLTIKVTKMI